MRTFIAINFEEDVINNLYKSVGKIRKELEALGYVVKWVPKENCHLTVRFLGEVSTTKLEEIKGAISKLELLQFRLVLKDLGVFPEYRNPRVLWAGIEGEVEKLYSLYKKVSEALKVIGILPEDREFRPHLTIGRVKIKGRGDIRGIFEKHSANWGSSKIRELVLYESKLLPEGPLYTPLWKGSFF